MKIKLLLSTLLLPTLLNAQTWTDAKLVAAPEVRPEYLFSDAQNNIYEFGNTRSGITDSRTFGWFITGTAEFSKYDASRARIAHTTWASATISDVVYDGTGFYLSGTFTNTLTLGSTTLQSKGENDVFVAKMDESGQVVFAKSFGGTKMDKSGAVCVTSDGNVLFTASLKGPATVGTNTIPDGEEKLLWSVVDKSTGDFVSTKLIETIMVPDTLSNGPEKNILKIRRTGNTYLSLLASWGKENIGSTTVVRKGFVVYLVKSDLDMNVSSFVEVGNTLDFYYDYEVIGLEADNAGNGYTLDFVAGKYGGTGRLQKFNSSASARVWINDEPNSSAFRYNDLSIEGDGLAMVGQEDWIPVNENSTYGNEVIIKLNLDKTEDWKVKHPDLRIAQVLKVGNKIIVYGKFVSGSVVLGSQTLTEADENKRWFIGEMQDGVVSVNDINDPSRIIAGPNPVKGLLNISGQINEEVEIAFYNGLGQHIKAIQIGETGNFNVAVNTSNFPEGILFYKVQDKSGRLLRCEKVLVVR